MCIVYCGVFSVSMVMGAGIYYEVKRPKQLKNSN